MRDFTEFGALIVGERHKIPTAALSFGAQLRDPQLLAALVAEPLALLRPGITTVPDVVGRARLHFAPTVFVGADGTLPEAHHLLRPDVFDATTGDDLPGWMGQLPDRPTVYVTLGTVWSRPDLVQPILNGLAELPLNVIVTTGRFDPDELDIPTNCRAERYIPNTALLPHVDVVVTHGGYTTVMGVIAAAKPMVLIPFSADQPASALRCTELGIGATIEPGDLTARAAHDATAKVLHDDRYQDRVAVVAADLAAMPGPDVAADILEATIR